MKQDAKTRGGNPWASPLPRSRCIGIARRSQSATRGAFTLVEIMIVVAIVALLAVIAVPGFLRARKRAQAAQIMNDLRNIDAAVDQYAIETGKKSGDPVSMADWTAHVKKDTLLYRTGENILGDEYGAQTVDEVPFVPVDTYNELYDVADDDFWEPYNP